MPFKVFISHSVGPKELGILAGLAARAATHAIEPLVPDRSWSPPLVRSDVAQMIQAADCVVVLATSGGHHQNWVNAEVASAGNKQIILVTDAGIDVKFPAQNRVVIDRESLTATIQQVITGIQRLQLENQHREALGWLLVAGFLFFMQHE